MAPHMKKTAIILAAALGLATHAHAQTAQSDPAIADPAVVSAQVAPASDARTFRQEEIVNKAEQFFGEASSGIGQAVERVFRDQGAPVGYIEGEEVAGAVGVGLRYGHGQLVMRDGQTMEVFWQGPSIGFDSGANASKVFTLVYDLGNPAGIFRRYPGVEGAAFFIAGLSVTYQRAEGVTLAPIRTGVGLRAGVNAGYTAYSMHRRWLPF